ncbi:MAG: hypothetical protein ACI8RD_011763, partial [Bacillariaceae sp.]
MITYMLFVSVVDDIRDYLDFVYVVVASYYNFSVLISLIFLLRIFVFDVSSDRCESSESHLLLLSAQKRVNYLERAQKHNNINNT